jgi:hypothetical protein
MMGRILNRVSRVFTFNELHFFEELWSPEDCGRALDRPAARDLAAQLLAVQRNGYFTPGNVSAFSDEAEDILNQILGSHSSEVTFREGEVFQAFLQYEAGRHGAQTPCEQTPRNLFYTKEILDLYPEAHFVNMVRDPRAVLLSQKNKWRRHFLGATNIPYREAVRAWMNYHPITISKLWQSSIRAADQFRDDPRFQTTYFEDLLQQPEAEVRRICDFLQINFDPGLLEIPQVGSSIQEDQPSEQGIDPSRRSKWKEGGLSDTEIFYCQKTVRDAMQKHEYALEAVQPNPFRLVFSAITFPLKLGGALVLNMSRIQNLVETIRRRLV